MKDISSVFGSPGPTEDHFILEMAHRLATETIIMQMTAEGANDAVMEFARSFMNEHYRLTRLGIEGAAGALPRVGIN